MITNLLRPFVNPALENIDEDTAEKIIEYAKEIIKECENE
jgi:HEPN domain-containing protein